MIVLPHDVAVESFRVLEARRVDVDAPQPRARPGDVRRCVEISLVVVTPHPTVVDGDDAIVASDRRVILANHVVGGDRAIC